MSDIKKELTLVARLDTSGIQKQLDELRKMSGSVGGSSGGGEHASISDNTQIDSFKKAFDGFTSTLGDLSKEFQKVLGNIKGIGGTAPGVQPGVNDRGGSKSKDKMAEVFDPTRGVYKKLREGEQFDKASGKKFKNEEDLIAFREAQEKKQLNKAKEIEEKNQQKSFKNDDAALEKKSKQELDDVKSLAQEKRAQEMSIAKEVAAFNERAMRDAYQKHPALLDSREDSEHGPPTPPAPNRMETFRNVAGVASGLGGAGLAALQLQRTAIQFENQRSLDTLSGNSLEGAIREHGRRNGSFGSLSGAAAGAGSGALAGAAVGSFVPGIGTAIGAGVGAIGGGIAGYFGGRGMQGEKEVDEKRVGLEAFKQASELIPHRMEALRGGGTDLKTLTELQGGGAEQGFSPMETLNQFNTARRNIGNRGASKVLGSLQELQNQTGMNVGQTSQGIETLMGAAGLQTKNGTSAQSQGLLQFQEMFRKGVALGFDSSRVRDLMQTSNEFLKEQTGLAKINTSVLSDRLASLAKGFTGPEGELTSTSLSQAKQAAEIERGQSYSTQGISGIANISDIMDVNKKYKGNINGVTQMSLARLSSGATEEDYGDVLDAQKDLQISDRKAAIKDMMARKQEGSFKRGADKLGLGEDTRIFLQQEELGDKPTEDVLGLRRAQKTANTLGPLKQGEMPAGAAAGGDEFKNTVLQAQQAQTVFVTSISNITTANDTLHGSIVRLTNDIKSSINAIKAFGDQINETSREIGRRPKH